MAMDPPRRTTVGRVSVTEVDARRPGYSRPPPAELDPVPTVRPPAFHPQPIPREYQRQPLPTTTARREAEHEPTLTGLSPTPHAGADEPDEWEEKSTVQALASADKLTAELAERNRELAAERAEKAALQRNLEAAKRAPVFTGPTEKQLRKAALHSAIVKVLIALAGTLGAVTAYLAVHSASTIPPRVENAEVRTKVVEDASGADHAALLALTAYLRAEQDRRDCLDSQVASAIVRGTGHRVSGAADVNWIESSMPSRRPTLTWDRAVWFPSSPCANEPKVP